MSKKAKASVCRKEYYTFFNVEKKERNTEKKNASKLQCIFLSNILYLICGNTKERVTKVRFTHQI